MIKMKMIGAAYKAWAGDLKNRYGIPYAIADVTPEEENDAADLTD